MIQTLRFRVCEEYVARTFEVDRWFQKLGGPFLARSSLSTSPNAQSFGDCLPRKSSICSPKSPRTQIIAF